MSSLTVRKLEIDLTRGFGRRWLGGDAYRTHLFNALSMMFPIGEQMFIDSLRAVPPERITDPRLLADIKDFVGQEASHRFVHIQYNAQLERQGLKYFLEPLVRHRVAFIGRRDVRSRLAVTCALEHYTAILADGVLRYPEWLEGAEPGLRLLWSWHAAEESEHKAVAFDAYRAAGGGYVRRVLWFLHISCIFWLDTFLQTAHNLHRDGALLRAGTWASAMRTWWGRRGIGRHLILPFFQYLKPSFHPWQHDNRQFVELWLSSNMQAYRAVGSTAVHRTPDQAGGSR